MEIGIKSKKEEIFIVAIIFIFGVAALILMGVAVVNTELGFDNYSNSEISKKQYLEIEEILIGTGNKEVQELIKQSLEDEKIIGEEYSKIITIADRDVNNEIKQNLKEHLEIIKKEDNKK